jgi:hypothetical protein
MGAVVAGATAGGVPGGDAKVTEGPGELDVAMLLAPKR